MENDRSDGKLQDHSSHMHSTLRYTIALTKESDLTGSEISIQRHGKLQC